MASTETISSRYRGLDAWGDAEVLDAFWEGQARAIAAVRPALASIAAAASAAAARLAAGEGRIVYAGAGSSGFIAALDGSELGGTFGWPDERVVFLLAGGTDLKPGIAGGTEDDRARARAEAGQLALGRDDVVVAVAASGRTPYTLGVLEAAAEAGAMTVAVANNPEAPLFARADHRILLESGVEIISGSTRMNAGTAQKAALGLWSSLLMIRLGRIYDGMMVDLRVENAKLEVRARDIVATIAGCGEAAAGAALEAAAKRIKPAALVAAGLSPERAELLLAASGNNLRTALASLDRAGGREERAPVEPAPTGNIG